MYAKIPRTWNPDACTHAYTQLSDHFDIESHWYILNYEPARYYSTSSNHGSSYIHFFLFPSTPILSGYIYIHVHMYICREDREVDNVSDFVLYCKILESFNDPTDSIDQNSIVTRMIILQRKDLDSKNPNISINWRTPFLCREIDTLTTEIVEIYVIRNGRRLTEERTTRDSVRKTRFFFKTYDISSEYWLAEARHFRSLASRIPEHGGDHRAIVSCRKWVGILKNSNVPPSPRPMIRAIYCPDI